VAGDRILGHHSFRKDLPGTAPTCMGPSVTRHSPAPSSDFSPESHPSTRQWHVSCIPNAPRFRPPAVPLIVAVDRRQWGGLYGDELGFLCDSGKNDAKTRGPHAARVATGPSGPPIRMSFARARGSEAPPPLCPVEAEGEARGAVASWNPDHASGWNDVAPSAGASPVPPAHRAGVPRDRTAAGGAATPLRRA
jgi:hypothetical protein